MFTYTSVFSYFCNICSGFFLLNKTQISIILNKGFIIEQFWERIWSMKEKNKVSLGGLMS